MAGLTFALFHNMIMNMTYSYMYMYGGVFLVLCQALILKNANEWCHHEKAKSNSLCVIDLAHGWTEKRNRCTIKSNILTNGFI